MSSEEPNPTSSAAQVVVVTQPSEALVAALGKSSAKAEKPPVEDVVSEHTVTIEGQEVRYRAIVGQMPVTRRGDKKKDKASIGFVAYLRLDVESPSERPITYAFNGGPGSSSVWLHMGVLGPRRVSVDVGSVTPPPWVAVPNGASILDRTDLVFIDPVSTGFSKPDGEGKTFYGVEGDLESVGDFIRAFHTKQGRWSSPTYLAGESYGTTRAAALADHLQLKVGIYPRGLVLLSLALDFQTLLFDWGNDLPYITLLPSFAAVAHYHGCLEWDGGLADLLSEVERFSLDEYAPALLRGGRLSQDEREALAEKIAGYTGLSADFVLRCNNRVALGRFAAELLRHKRRQVGRLDARFVGMGTDAAKETLELDPSLHHIVGPFAAAFHHHLRHELGVEHDETYEFLNMDVHPWTFDGCENRYLDVGERLLRAMNCNPHLTIFVGSGLYDLATPYFAADHTVARIGQEPEVFGRFVVETYEAGHMMYLHEPSLAKLRGDLVRFYDAGSV